MKNKLLYLSCVVLLYWNKTAGQTFTDLLHLQYGTATQNTLDLYLPEKYTDSTAVVMMIHGGAWVMGGNFYTEKTCRDLRGMGFIVANVDYRYVNDSTHCDALLHDINEAVEFVQHSSAKYHFRNKGYHFIGISAGAHLALLYAYTAKKEIKSVTALCAPVKLDDELIFAFLKQNGVYRNVELLANDQYKEGEKPGKKFTAVSPYAHVKNIPTLLIHGDKDELVPISQSQFLYSVLQNKNIQSKFITMEGKGHDVGMNQPESEKVILNEIGEWIRKYL